MLRERPTSASGEHDDDTSGEDERGMNRRWSVWVAKEEDSYIYIYSRPVRECARAIYTVRREKKQSHSSGESKNSHINRKKRRTYTVSFYVDLMV